MAATDSKRYEGMHLFHVCICDQAEPKRQLFQQF